MNKDAYYFISVLYLIQFQLLCSLSEIAHFKYNHCLQAYHNDYRYISR